MNGGKVAEGAMNILTAFAEASPWSLPIDETDKLRVDIGTKDRGLAALTVDISTTGKTIAPGHEAHESIPRLECGVVAGRVEGVHGYRYMIYEIHSGYTKSSRKKKRLQRLVDVAAVVSR